MSGGAIPTAENGGEPFGGRSFAPNNAGELTTLPRSPSWWGGGLLSLLKNPALLAGVEGTCCPRPQEPQPALGLQKFGVGFRPFGLGSNEKFWARPCWLSRSWSRSRPGFDLHHRIHRRPPVLHQCRKQAQLSLSPYTAHSALQSRVISLITLLFPVPDLVGYLIMKRLNDERYIKDTCDTYLNLKWY